MKGMVIGVLLGAIAVALMYGMPKTIAVKPPDEIQAEVGPTHKRLEFSTRNGRKLFNIDVYEDGKNINVKPKGEAEIKVK